ncbi:hypothetical protein [Methylobacterium oryzisoli]|uniref:hypothetical protein n=1 Tax=Methylobacterium oryzisoli TaxID=3385502 RepID=UPI00389269F7
MSKKADLQALADKGPGVLVKRGAVWTYPGAPVDSAGTNLQLPVEYVSDADVQEALSGGDLVAAVVDPFGVVSAVRVAGGEVKAVTMGLAGSAEMGTELPPNSRVEHDAGRVMLSQAEAEQQAVQGVTGEGAEIAGRDKDNDPRTKQGGRGPFNNEASTDTAGPRKGR